MKFQKQHLCNLPFCYAVGCVQASGRTKYIFATDDTGPCYAMDAESLECKTVWDGPGGTMSIIPLPGQNGAFLASQNFMPGFSASHARIVKVSYQTDTWQVEPWMDLPYVHRFDLLERNGTWYFLGCVLSTTTQEQAEWDKPGVLVAAPLSPSFAPPAQLTTIAQGMFRNHGYCRVEREGYTQAYTACDQGIFQITPPAAPNETWTVRQLLDLPASDVAVCDIDGDGQEELAAIEPFHGASFVIYHAEGSHYKEIYRYPKPAPFLHAIWGGKLRGRPVFLAGCRENDQEFFLVNHNGASIQAHIIETGHGPSNVAVLPGTEQDIILIANRQSHEGALFYVQEETKG